MSESSTIAIVDDDLAIREALNDILRSCGYATLAFESAESFLATAVLADIDCIILDVKMQGLSGLELQEALNTRPSRPPIVFMTSYYDEYTMSAAMAGGAHDILNKPVDDEILLASLRSAIAASDE